MKTMTIRNIPDEVAAYISGRASEEGRSINTMTVAILTRASGRSSALRQTGVLQYVFGKRGAWTKMLSSG